MQNLSIKRWQDLNSYLEGREHILCEENHSLVYLRAWSECYHRSEAILEFLKENLAIKCDCKALDFSRNKLKSVNAKKAKKEAISA